MKQINIMKQIDIDRYNRWRKMFDKDPDYQKEFCQWLIDKGEAKKTTEGEYVLLDNHMGWIFPTRAMLTGYILSFMEERMK